MFSISSLWRKTIILTIGFLVLAGGVFVPVQGAQISTDYYSKNGDIIIDKTSENLYLAGNNIKVYAPIKKDLTVAGGTVRITGKVERSILVAGGTVEIDSSYVGATVRVTGGDVRISGNFNEDVVVAGGNVTFKDAQIRGDVLVSGGKVSLENTKVFGNFWGSYGQIDGDLSNSVNGEIRTYTVKSNNADSTNVLFLFAKEFSQIFALIIIVYILYSRNRLGITEVKFNKVFGFDILVGLAYLIIPTLVLIVGSIFQLYPLLLTLWALLGLLFILSSVFVPVYLANLVQNTFNFKIPLYQVVIITYLSELILGFITVVNIIFGFAYFIIFLANFGFLSKKFISTINFALSDKTEE